MESGCRENSGQDPPKGREKQVKANTRGFWQKSQGAGMPGRVCRGQQETPGIPESSCKRRSSQDWLSTPVISAFEKLRHKSGEFRASLDYRARL